MKAQIFLALLLLTTRVTAGEQAFLELNDGQRFWFYEGAFRTVSHLISLSDRKKGDCAANWYLKDREAKRKLVEDRIKANPELGETTVILSLLTHACGPLVPEKALTGN